MVLVLPEPVCGNGVLEENEECDDGNLDNNDGCSSLCEIEEIECCDDGDCPDDVALPPTCKNNDIFGNYIDWFCSNNECQSEIKDFFVQDCGEDSCNDFEDNYCKGDDVYHLRTCYNKGCSNGSCFCSNGSCFNEDYEDEELVEDCAYDCVNGECKEEEDDHRETWCIETNNCELTYDDSAEFDDSITLKSNDLNQTLGSIMLGSNVSEREPVSYFWITAIAIAIIILLILIFFLLI